MNTLTELDEFKRLILIVGTPGVGKTITSSLLASKLDGLHIDLAELVKQEELISDVDEVRETLVADVEKVSERVQEITRDCAGDVIVDGHYAFDVVPAEKVHRVFVIRKHPDELETFLEKRGFRNKKLWENLAAEVLDICLSDAVEACGVDRVCEIDASGKSVEAIVEDIIRVLDGKSECRVGTIDWLGRLAEDGRLHKYLIHF
ncbi:MAG: adenylate kinase family protein [Candidatus Bathyarchaeota archaeon]|nr:MAG: adenylate kinase family protein [Candidatus Bathyarchaeota archaeon]